MAVHTLFLLHSHLLAVSNAVFPLQTPASVMELVDVPDSKSGAARRGGSSPPRGTTDGTFNANCFPKIPIYHKAQKPI